MTNLNELMNAVERVKIEIAISEYGKTPFAKDCEALVNLAESVLNAECPKEKEIPKNIHIKDCISLYEARDIGYNHAIQDFKLWHTKCLAGLEDVVKNSSLCHLCLSNVSEGEQEMEELIISIRNLFNDKRLSEETMDNIIDKIKNS